MFRNMLAYKCEKDGGVLIKVEPKFTSQDCSCCSNRVKKSLSIRTHICTKCGTVLDRDHNASLNILQRGIRRIAYSKLNTMNCRARLCPNSIIYACGDCVRHIGNPTMLRLMNQEAPSSNTRKGVKEGSFTCDMEKRNILLLLIFQDSIIDEINKSIYRIKEVLATLSKKLRGNSTLS